MASTRNKNTPGDYKMAIVSDKNRCGYLENKFYGAPSQSFLPGFGLLGSKIAPSHLSSNSCDIESSLFGIGSTNLVQPQPNVAPQLKSLSSLAITERPVLVMPRPIDISQTERPMFRN
jgi:hypothetical protein